jgi:GNAT superfamily N-acetyltransferase
LLRTRAANSAAHTRALAAIDPSWGSRASRLADGWLVLSGAGLYVNRAMAAGLDAPLSDADLDRVVTESEAMGVPPAIEVTSATHRDTVDRLARRGFVHDPESDITLFTRSLVDDPGQAPTHLFIRTVGSEADLEVWQQTSAMGWGHDEAEPRRASDAYVAAAFSLPNEILVIAYDAADGRPVGCASTTVRDGLAGLGGMSTVPAERRRGVQAALLRHRLEHAIGIGCDLASATAATGSASGRNLRRHGFIERATIETHVLDPS